MRLVMRGKIILICFFILAVSVNAEAYTFAWETISGSQVYGTERQLYWNYSYDIGFYDDTLQVDVDIKLDGVVANSVIMDMWESGMESMWSTRRFSVPIVFNVDWVTSDYDQAVTVHSGPGRANITNWYLEPNWGPTYHEETAAHEFGHMLSLYDEYTGGAVNPNTRLTETGGLMHTLNGLTLDYYYDPFLEWYNGKVGAYQAGIGATVPEPTTLLLFAAGMTVLAGARRRRKN